MLLAGKVPQSLITHILFVINNSSMNIIAFVPQTNPGSVVKTGIPTAPDTPIVFDVEIGVLLRAIYASILPIVEERRLGRANPHVLILCLLFLYLFLGLLKIPSMVENPVARQIRVVLRRRQSTRSVGWIEPIPWLAAHADHFVVIHVHGSLAGHTLRPVEKWMAFRACG